MKNYVPPKRPEKLDADCAWVAIAAVHVSDGNGPGEKTWACEYCGRGSTEAIALHGARCWFSDTDQSRPCEVTMSVERADGTIVGHRIKIGPEVVARVVRQA